MNRFWVFPLVLGVVGAVGLTLLGVEANAPMMFFYRNQLFPTPYSPHRLWLDLMASTPWGVGIGVVLGLLAGAFDTFFNVGKRRSGGQLVGNLFWCLVYAHAFIIPSLAFGIWALSSRGGPSGFAIVGVYAPLLFWLLAIGWATVRTIAAPDVLSPRVLGDKLRRSMKLEG